MRLIVNADDFGLTKGVTLGILDSMEKGIVTSTTALVNSLYFEEGIKEAMARGIDAIGIHLTLTLGKPILPPEDIHSIVREDGTFYKSIKDIKGIDYNHVKKELEAQLVRFMNYFHNPTHIDGHHHFYIFDKEILNIVIELAKEYELPLRCVSSEDKEYYDLQGVKTTDNIILDFYGENISVESLIGALDNSPESITVELMCHPAFIDEELVAISTYNTLRKIEHSILVSEKINEFICASNIKLISFKEL